MTKDFNVALVKEQGLPEMLVRVLPKQVAKGWHTIAPLLAQSMPPEIAVSRDILTNMLAAILREDLQIWLEQDESKPDIYRALIATTLWKDPVVCIDRLLIYNLFIIHEVPLKDWKAGIATLKMYGESRGCSSLVGFVDSSDDKYIKFLKMLGGELSTRIVVF